MPGCALELRVHSGYAANANSGLVCIIILSWCLERPGRTGHILPLFLMQIKYRIMEG